jgi:hypothetical protein
MALVARQALAAQSIEQLAERRRRGNRLAHSPKETDR